MHLIGRLNFPRLLLWLSAADFAADIEAEQFFKVQELLVAVCDHTTCHEKVKSRVANCSPSSQLRRLLLGPRVSSDHECDFIRFDQKEECDP